MTERRETLNVEQATSYLGVSRSTFTRWRRARVVEDKGRWTREELDQVTAPKGKPRGKTSAKKADDTPRSAPGSKTDPTHADPEPEAKPAEPEKREGSYDPKDPYKLDLPQKRPRVAPGTKPGTKPTQTDTTAKDAAKVDHDDDWGWPASETPKEDTDWWLS